MSRSQMCEWGIALVARIYGMLLFIYPSSFRRRYGREMVQVFRAACRHSARHGTSGLIPLWASTLADLVVTASAERLSEMCRQNGPLRPYVYTGALLLSLVTGYLHLRSDADALSMVLVLSGAWAFGLAYPAGTWRLAVIIGLGIPAALLVAHGIAAPSVPRRDADVPLPASLVPALIGAYTGALMHRLLPRLMVFVSFGRQQSK